MSAEGIVYLVGAGPGDPDLITLKGLEVLKKADVIVYDRLINKRLLLQAPVLCELIEAGKTREAPEHLNAVSTRSSWTEPVRGNGWSASRAEIPSFSAAAAKNCCTAAKLESDARWSPVSPVRWRVQPASRFR